MDNPLWLAELPTRPGKPRETGLTMVRDDGMPLAELQQVLDGYGALLDHMKFRQFVAWYLPTDDLRAKVAACAAADVRTVVGGTVLEAAYLHGESDRILDAMAEFGLTSVEVSQSMVPRDVAELTQVVRRAAGLGLEVLYEYGKKFQESAAEVGQAVDDMHALLAAGASRIIIERWQLDAFLGPEGDASTAGRVVELADAVGLRNLVFEAETLTHQVWLIRELGVEVNLGPNIAPFHVPAKLEPFRHGLGSEVGYAVFPRLVGQLGADR